MANNIERGYLASVILKKTAGVAANPIVGFEWLIPPGLVDPTNNPNMAFPTLVNKAANVSNSVQGKYTPSVVISFPVKPNIWGTLGANLLKACLTNRDANGNTDEFALKITEDNGTTRIFTHMRCVGVNINCNATGMPVSIDIAFLAVYGDNQDASPPTFTTTPAVNPGALTSVIDVSATGATDLVAFSLSMQCATAYEFYLDGTANAQATNSGYLSGTLVLVQNSRAATVPGSPGTISLKVGATGNGVQIDLSLVKTGYDKNVTPGFVNQTNVYVLADVAAGASPVTFTAI